MVPIAAGSDGNKQVLQKIDASQNCKNNRAFAPFVSGLRRKATLR
jgi:hypothetical protein